jgi:thiol:disulfide interchange protein
MKINMTIMKHRLFAIFLFMTGAFVAKAQLVQPVKWTFSQEHVSGQVYSLHFKAAIDEGWHLYSDKLPEGGPIATSFHFEPSTAFTLDSLVSKTKPIQLFDKTFNMDLEYFSNKAEFVQYITLVSAGPVVVEGYVEFMSCNDETCTPPTEADFKFELNTEKKSEGGIAPVATGGENRGLLVFFLISFLAGLAAILTPCVFPMIPMTVSFFMHGGETKARSRINASIYGLSIIGIYTVVGTLVAVFFGPGIANWLSTHWIPNLIFFAVFILFAFSFFGMFEIVLPSWLVNKADKGADKGGAAGAFFMALTLVLVSFSCTGPIVGAILVESAGGQVLKPIIGMLGFSLAFALPFTLFALFPQWLSNLPKSGGWLNSVKVVLGFIELALGLKFLSVADQTYHWGLLDREIYIAIWIVIFTLLGFYLLGKLKFAHDSEVKHVSVPRLMLSIVTFSFVVYLVPGLFGAPLKGISGYMPPMATHDFDFHKIIRDEVRLVTQTSNTSFQFSSDQSIEGCDEPKFAEFLHLPHGLEGYFDYEQALACSKAQNKPLFIDFTGHGCVNCREMEATVWSDPRVLERLKNNFVIVALYVDDKTKLPESEWVTSEYDGKVKKTLGKKYADFQISRFKVNAQPYYVILDHNEEMLVQPTARDLNPDNFVKFLDEAVAKFNGK